MLLASPAEADVRQVVLLQSFDRGNLVLDRFTSVLRLQVDERSEEPVTFTEFVVNPAGFTDAPEQAIVEFLRSAFVGRPKPDLVITTGGPAAAFARKHRTQIFPDSPTLYAAVDQRFLRSGAFTDSETAVAVANDPTSRIVDILRLFPGTEQVFVIIGSGELGRFWRREFEAESGPFRDRVRFSWSEGMRYAAMLQLASTLPPRSAIFFSSFDVDAEGATYPTERVLADLRARASVPIFGGQGAELGYGVIGGSLISTDEISRRTADVALRILAGESPALVQIPVQQPGPPAFDWRQLRRWGVGEDRLPADSVVLFREPGVWDRFKWVIVGSALALAAQTLLITALLVGRAKRRRAEQSLRESEGRFRVLANSAPVMIRTTGADARATDFNVPWLDFTGRGLDVERGDGWLDGVHPDDVAACVEMQRRAFEGRKPYRMEYRLRRADGEYRWLLDSGEPRFSPDGFFAGYIGSAIDITDLKAARATLSNLNRRLMEAQEQERSRLARELHDDVCQRMAVFALNLDRLVEEIPESETDARGQLRDLFEEVKALARHVNGISHRLHSSKLEFLGLSAAAGTFCREISTHHEVTVEFVHDNVPSTLRDGVAINLFRVLQEALSNAVKHSGASRFYVLLRGTETELLLEVRDEGRGFDPAAAMATSGLGLVSMQERLRLVNGEVTLESRPGAGTTVRAVVPLRPHVAASVQSVGDDQAVT